MRQTRTDQHYALTFPAAECLPDKDYLADLEEFGRLCQEQWLFNPEQWLKQRARVHWWWQIGIWPLGQGRRRLHRWQRTVIPAVLIGLGVLGLVFGGLILARTWGQALAQFHPVP